MQVSPFSPVMWRQQCHLHRNVGKIKCSDISKVPSTQLILREWQLLLSLANIMPVSVFILLLLLLNIYTPKSLQPQITNPCWLTQSFFPKLFVQKPWAPFSVKRYFPSEIYLIKKKAALKVMRAICSPVQLVGCMLMMRGLLRALTPAE